MNSKKNLKKFGTSSNPIVVKLQTSPRLLLSYMTAIGERFEPLDVSKLNGRKTLECYLTNVITNPALTDLGVIIALWLRQNIGEQGDILQLSNDRRGRLDAYVGEHVRSSAPEKDQDLQSLEQNVLASVADIVDDLDKMAWYYLHDNIDAYKDLIDSHTVEEIEELISVVSHCLGDIDDSIEEENEVLAENANGREDFKDSEKNESLHQTAKLFLSLNLKRWIESNPELFVERAGSVWSRSQIHEFALEHLEFDKEDLEYFEELNLEAMLQLIKEYYFIADKKESLNRPHLAIYLKGFQPLRYPYDKNGKNSLVRFADVFDKLNLVYSRQDCYEELRCLHEYGYITMTPVNYVNSEAGVDTEEEEGPKAQDFVHIKLNTYMSKKDFSGYWLGLMAWNERLLEAERG